MIVACDDSAHLAAALAAALARAQLLSEGRQRVRGQQRRQVDLRHVEGACTAGRRAAWQTVALLCLLSSASAHALNAMPSSQAVQVSSPSPEILPVRWR